MENKVFQGLAGVGAHYDFPGPSEKFCDGYLLEQPGGLTPLALVVLGIFRARGCILQRLQTEQGHTVTHTIAVPAVENQSLTLI